MGRLDVKLQKKGQAWKDVEAATGGENSYTGTVTELSSLFGEDPGMKRLTETYRRSTRFVKLSEDEIAWKKSKRFLTVETCQGCHEEQTTFWQGTTHAHAYATLEKTGDEFRYDCMPCHVLAYGETFIDAHEVGEFKNVQCESCHGTNPRHPLDPERVPWPRNDKGRLVDDKPCWACHNPAVTRVAFTPREMIPKIACPPMTRSRKK